MTYTLQYFWKNARGEAVHEERYFSDNAAGVLTLDIPEQHAENIIGNLWLTPEKEKR